MGLLAGHFVECTDLDKSIKQYYFQQEILVTININMVNASKVSNNEHTWTYVFLT